MKDLSYTKNKKVYYLAFVVVLLAALRFVPIASKHYYTSCSKLDVKTHYTIFEKSKYDAAPTDLSPADEGTFSCVYTGEGRIGLYIL